MTRSSDITSAIDLYDADIKKITDGPVAWHQRRMGARRSIDDHQKALTEQFELIGLRADVQVWAVSSDQGASLDDGFVFQVLITDRCEPESGFDYDQFQHEIRNNLLEIPGEGGTIKFDEAEFLREHGGGKHGRHAHGG